MAEDISRKKFFGIVGALAVLVGFFSWLKLRREKVKPHFVGPAIERGHAMRTAFTPPVAATAQKIDTAIIGGGISGLSAGWYLEKHGFKDFSIFELENRAGGNAQWGENRVGRYPWGAHYLPTPGSDAVYVRELLTEMGIFKNGEFSAEALVHEAEERLFIYGAWRPGLVPLMGARAADRHEFENFFALIKKLRHQKTRDGKKPFTIPLALSSRDADLLAYDTITAEKFLRKHGFVSRRLDWYVDYVLRDEYGSNRTNTSAWALLHYFCSRSESHNLVWPEGNGYIAAYLKKKLQPYLHEQIAVRQIQREGNGYNIYLTDAATGTLRKIHAQRIVFSAPKFILPYVYPELDAKKRAAVGEFVYSPWLTVNLLVNHFAAFEPAWDNVTYGSLSLGYVVAEHQRIGKLPHARTLTFFHAFDADDTLQSKRSLLSMSERDIYGMALRELTRPHSEIEENIEDVGIYRWAHAMIRPRPGFISGDACTHLREIARNFYGAHSDLSGMSNFEEAQYQGVSAAQKILQQG
ncbi:MAG: NAD(P)-binding protein [Spirochaetes bacterium]|nr:NAD(P)-binding protein [Spirochaetota bacterium]